MSVSTHETPSLRRQCSVVSTTYLNPTDTTDLEIQWGDEVVSIKDLLRDSLPQVVKVTVESVKTSGEQGSRQLGVPLLLHSARRCSKVLAECLQWNKEKEAYEETGQQLVIPISYKGWFELIPDRAGEAVEFYETVSQIGEQKPEKFLVTSPILGYQRVAEGFLRHQISRGTVMKLLNVYDNGVESRARGILKYLTCCTDIFNFYSSEPDDELNGETYLHCVDCKGVEVLLPYGRSGMFFPIGDPGSKRYDVVYQLCDIVRHLELPLDMRLVEGSAPQGSKSFTGKLRVIKEFSDETIMASTLCKSIAGENMFEISENSPLRFNRARIMKDVVNTNMYKSALRACDANCEKYASSIKFTQTRSEIKPSDNLETIEEKNENLENLENSFAGRSLPPIPSVCPEEAFACSEPDYDVIPGADVGNEDYLVPATIAENRDKAWKNKHNSSFTKATDDADIASLYSNIKKKKVKIAPIQLAVPGESSTDYDDDFSFSDDEQSMLAQLEQLFNISTETITELDNESIKTGSDDTRASTVTVAVQDTQVSTLACTEQPNPADSPGGRKRTISEDWLRDARKARHSVADLRKLDNEVFTDADPSSPSNQSSRRLRMQSLMHMLATPTNQFQDNGDDYYRRRLGSADRTIVKRPALKYNPNATIRVHNIKKRNRDSHEPLSRRGRLQDIDFEYGYEGGHREKALCRFNSLRNPPRARSVRHESTSSINSAMTDSGFITPPSPGFETDASSPYDYNGWTPPFDVSSLSVDEIVKCLRYIGMKPAVLSRFRDEQIDGKMFKELDENLLKEGFSDFNAFERKKILDFINGWRPRKQ